MLTENLYIMNSYNYSTQPQQQPKPYLYIKSGASRGLKLLYNFWKIVFVVIPCAIGLLLFIYGCMEESPGLMVISIRIIISALISLVFLQFLNSLVVRTRAAEYYIAEMEDRYDIRR
jgi:uncharacterized membrane protein